MIRIITINNENITVGLKIMVENNREHNFQLIYFVTLVAEFVIYNSELDESFKIYHST